MSHLPSFLVGPLITLFIPALSGYLAHIAFDYVDDVQQWTAKLPADVKRLVVAALASGIVLLNQKYGLSLPTDTPITEAGVQSAIAAAVAYFLKHASKPDEK